jgi:hypothetical protein
MKHLFHEKYETYTTEANNIATAIRLAVEPIIKGAIEHGYLSHEVEVIALSEISLITAYIRLTRNSELYKAERIEKQNKKG